MDRDHKRKLPGTTSEDGAGVFQSCGSSTFVVALSATLTQSLMPV